MGGGGEAQETKVGGVSGGGGTRDQVVWGGGAQETKVGGVSWGRGSTRDKGGWRERCIGDRGGRRGGGGGGAGERSGSKVIHVSARRRRREGIGLYTSGCPHDDSALAFRCISPATTSPARQQCL